MTTVPITAPSRRHFGLVIVVTAVGLAALWLRPWLIARATPSIVLAFVFGALLGIGLAVPIEEPLRRRVIPCLAVGAIGSAAVVAAHLLVSGRAAVPLAGRFVVLDIVAAVAEEAFFRRFLHGVLRPYGMMAAVLVPTALFTIVHLTSYGAWVLPLDFAAGLLFAWQREATGRWIVPAVTHVIANLLVVL